jgi:opacity protein-like surface antigen
MAPAPQHTLAALIVAASIALAAPTPAWAGQQQPAVPQRSTGGQRIGVQGFGMAAMNWTVASKSFEAAGLDARPIEVGGGGQVTGIWRNLFAQVSASRWSSTGERVFVDSSGTAFPLGIPLHVKATYVDVSTGWKFGIRRAGVKPGVLPYIGAGMGVVMYSEDSPFAQPGDDLNARSASYHVIAGLEIPLLKWVGVTADARYRFVPNLLGEDGASGALGEDDFGGGQIGIGLRIGIAGTSAPPRRRPAPPVKQQETTPPRRIDEESAVLIEAAPVFLLPDATRTPLRVLSAGTVVSVLEQSGDWVRVQFSDQQFGPRVGYVQRKYVQFRKQDPRLAS